MKADKRAARGDTGEPLPRVPTRRLCVVMHDVAPARWQGCLRVLALVRAAADAAGVEVPVTLLVVPKFHGEEAAPRLAAPFLRWLHHMARDGHETALHGFTHRDESGAAGGWRDHALRHWYTASEGEFAAVDRAEADRRIALGRRWFADRRLQARGFVAPAWLLGEPAWQAVAAAGFAYSATLTQVVALPTRRALHARSLVFSTRSGWRRVLSVVWNTCVAWRLRDAPLMRFELHPDDADHPAVRRCWTRLLARALREREAVTLAEAAGAI